MYFWHWCVAACPSLVDDWFLLITLRDVASFDVDTVGLVVGASLTFCVLLIIVVKSCSAFAFHSFAFVVRDTAAFIYVRRLDAAMRVLFASKIVGILQCSGYILAELDMRILWVDGTQYFLLQ